MVKDDLPIWTNLWEAINLLAHGPDSDRNQLRWLNPAYERFLKYPRFRRNREGLVNHLRGGLDWILSQLDEQTRKRVGPYLHAERCLKRGLERGEVRTLGYRGISVVPGSFPDEQWPGFTLYVLEQEARPKKWRRPKDGKAFSQSPDCVANIFREETTTKEHRPRTSWPWHG